MTAIAKLSTLLVVDELDAYYGEAQVLAGISLTVAAGEVVVLLGRNGAGKSTTLKSVMGLVRCRGTRSFRGHQLTELAVPAIARCGIGYVPEERRIFAELTVLENLEVGRQPPRSGFPCWDLDAVFALFPSLAELRRRPGGLLSGGEQQMLTIARTLMGNPALILLDEPSEGLAPLVVKQLTQAIISLKQAGMGILLSEQNRVFAESLADRTYRIDKGRIGGDGSAQGEAE